MQTLQNISRVLHTSRIIDILATVRLQTPPCESRVSHTSRIIDILHAVLWLQTSPCERVGFDCSLVKISCLQFSQIVAPQNTPANQMVISRADLARVQTLKFISRVLHTSTIITLRMYHCVSKHALANESDLNAAF